ncbi:hypothetical protein G9A89_002382 [Geosiphon pyriformis]|nr:hypothetical protein G9A89_002382 [Geosiphon pyriformis]
MNTCSNTKENCYSINKETIQNLEWDLKTVKRSLNWNPKKRPVTGTSSQSRNQETHDQVKKPNIRKAIFRNAQGNIIPPPLRLISLLVENSDEMATLYIAKLTDFSGEKEEMDIAIQTLPFFLKDTADSWYQSLETKPTSFTEFKNALLEYFSDPNTIIQLQNEFNTIKQGTGETVTQYLARFNQIHHQIKVLNQFIKELKSSILGRVCSAHPNFLPEAIMLTKAFELAEKEANHSQIVNIVMKKNKTKMLEKRVMQLWKELSKKIEKEIHTNHPKDAARKSATVEIIAHRAKNSEQKHVPAIFANA